MSSDTVAICTWEWGLKQALDIRQSSICLALSEFHNEPVSLLIWCKFRNGAIGMFPQRPRLLLCISLFLESAAGTAVIYFICLSDAYILGKAKGIRFV